MSSIMETRLLCDRCKGFGKDLVVELPDGKRINVPGTVSNRRWHGWTVVSIDKCPTCGGGGTVRDPGPCSGRDPGWMF